MANEYDTSKLPKWARERIALLENTVEHWKRLAKMLETGEGADERYPFRVRDVSDWKTDRVLPYHAIECVTGNGRFSITPRGEVIEINCGFANLIVRPRAGNSVEINAEEH